MKKIYLANPYGFSAQQKALLLPQLVAALEELRLEVWEPFARNNQVDFAEAGWAYKIGQADFRDVVESDGIFAVVNGVSAGRGSDGRTGDGDCFEEAYLSVPGRLPGRERQQRISSQPDALYGDATGRVAGLLLHVDRRDRVPGEGTCSVGAKLKMEAFE